MPTLGLDADIQVDFSGGMHRGVARHLIPKNGVYDIRNGLLDETGSIYKRGGTSYWSTSSFGSGLTFIWDGTLTGGQRTVIASPSSFASVSGGGTVTSLGGSGLTQPRRAVAYYGTLHIGGGATYDGSTLGSAARTSNFYGVAGGRLLTGEGDTIWESDRGDSSTFGATNFQRLPGGVQIIGVEGLRNAAAVFTTGGVFILNNVHLDLTDATGNPQQTLDRYSSDLVLWGDTGIAGWEGALVIPALDGVWLVSLGVSSEAAKPFQRLSDPIASLYRDYVTAGYRPGLAAVHRGTYLLPILDASGGTVDMLVCRLDQGGRWSRFDGFGAQVAGFNVRVSPSGGTRPILLGASTHARVLQCSYFDPDASVKLDADGTVPTWEVTGRDVQAAGFGQPALVERATVSYELEDAGSDNPTIQAAFGGGAPRAGGTQWGSFTWGSSTWSDRSDVQMTQAAGTAPEDEEGLYPYVFAVRRRARFLRWRLSSSQPAARLVLRAVELFIRPPGR